MQTSGLRSAVPPNHAATRPDLVSAIVEAWHDGNGAVLKMNSDFTTAEGGAAVAQAVEKSENKRTVQPKFRQVLECASPLALFISRSKRQRAAAVQDAVATAWPFCFIRCGK